MSDATFMPERTGTHEALDMQVRRADVYAQVLEAIFQRKYTGSFTVHCRDGVPKTVEFPGVQISLTNGTGLDKPDPSA